MSFVKNLFRSKKPIPSKQQAQLAKEIQKEKNSLHVEQTSEALANSIKKFQSKIEKQTEVNRLLKETVKRHLQAGHKDRAKIVLRKIKRNEELVIRMRKQVNILEKQSLGIEEIQTNQEFAEILAMANQVQLKNKNHLEDLNEELAIAKEVEFDREQSNLMFDELLQSDDSDLEEEIGELFEEYEKELQIDHVVQPHVQVPTTIKVPEKSEEEKKDEFSMLMAQMM